MLKNIVYYVLILIQVDAWAQLPGTLDATFGINGKVIISNPKVYQGFNGICMQSDNKILLCGNIDSISFTRLFITRLNPNGFLDASFANSGSYIDKILSLCIAYDMAIQTDGKILVTGYVKSNSPSATEEMFILRLLQNGSKDNSFGNNGIFISHIATPMTKWNYGKKIKIAQDGSIFIAGTVSAGQATNPGASIFKITPNGQLDTQFGIGGYRTFHLSFWDYCNGIDLQSDGKVLITGGTFSPDNTFTMRFNSNGSLDSSFATNGKFICNFPGNDEQGISINSSSLDKKSIISGYYESPNPNIFVYCLDSTGTLDLGYGNNGIVSVSNGFSLSPSSMVQISHKNLILSGKVDFGNSDDFYLVCLDSTGTVNSSFGNNGSISYDINMSEDCSLCSVMQSDGKILLAGFSDTNFVVIRLYTADYTSLEANIKESKIQVYPNPASSKININSPHQTINVVLFDVNGKEVFCEHNTTLKQLDISTLKEGIYNLKLSTLTNEFGIYKIIVKR